MDVADLGILAANYGMNAGATWGQGDFNGDGRVDLSDLGLLAAQYGVGTGDPPDFNRDAQALGLGVKDDQGVVKERTANTSLFGCGSGGILLIAGLLLMEAILFYISDPFLLLYFKGKIFRL